MNHMHGGDVQFKPSCQI